MKYFLIIPVLAALILSGCSKENSIVGPQQQQQNKSQWIQLDHSSSLSTQNSTGVQVAPYLVAVSPMGAFCR